MTFENSNHRPGREVSLQVQLPKEVKRELGIRSVETGKTMRALVLEGLARIGIEAARLEIYKATLRPGRGARRPQRG